MAFVLRICALGNLNNFNFGMIADLAVWMLDSWLCFLYIVEIRVMCRSVFSPRGLADYSTTLLIFTSNVDRECKCWQMYRKLFQFV